jgi:hypothetical protein
MSQAARNRASRRRKQPYAWLGVGAVTLGMGAAMVGGTAVAFADTGNPASDSAGTSSASEKAGNDAAPSNTDAPSPKRVTRGGVAAGTQAGGDSATAPSNRGRGGVVVADNAPDVSVTLPDIPKATPPVPEEATPIALPQAKPPAADNSPLPAAAVTPTRIHDSALSASTAAKVDAVAPEVDSTPAVPAAAASTAAVTPTPAAATPAAAAIDPAPSQGAWLPTQPIVPGASVKLAMDQIKQAQELLTAETWGSGNILAGLGSFGPASALATAQLALSIWSSTIAGAQAFVKNTADNPLIHWLAQANLQSEMLWPKVSDAALATANILMTPLNWVGADVTGAQTLTAAARENGKIYAQVPIKVIAGTQPTVGVKVAGGSKATLLVDTGASGLVTTRDKVNAANLGPVVGSGTSCFSGNLCYSYDTYNATVDLGDGAVAKAPVNIVAAADEAAFKQFFSWGADGILGVGANTAGPGPAPIPTANMPGELKNGVLIYQNAYPFGLGGYMILGPNLFPTRVSLPGAPDAYVDVSLNGSTPPKTSGAIIDSGGVFGTILRKDIPAGVTPQKIDGVDYLPAGVKISVYAPGTTTLLYTYTTIQGGTPVIDTGLFNTGNAPYAQNPIYMNYGATPYGIGSTDFSIA